MPLEPSCGNCPSPLIVRSNGGGWVGFPCAGVLAADARGAPGAASVGLSQVDCPVDICT
jgi:hypothetical protein